MTELKNGWIPVHRPPPITDHDMHNSDTVIILMPRGERVTGFYQNDEDGFNGWYMTGPDMYRIEFVLAWQPLPSPEM